MNGTRAFTLKAGEDSGEEISVCRVQTAVLSMLYDRCKEYLSFKKQVLSGPGYL